MNTEDLVLMFQDGHADAFPALWASVAPIARKVARRYEDQAVRNGGLDRDDLCQLASIGVWEAAKKYDPTRETRFFSWAAYYVRNYIRRSLILHRPCVDNMPKAALDAPIEGFDGEASLLDTIADEAATSPETAAECENMKRILHECLAKLREQEQDALRLVYMEGKTYEEAAALMGVPHSTVSGCIASGKQKLRHSPRLRTIYLPDSHYHVGVSRFFSTRTSAVEEIVMKRERAGL